MVGCVCVVAGLIPADHGALRKLFSSSVQQRDRKLSVEPLSALRGGSCKGSDCKYVPSLGWLENYSLAQQNGLGFISVVIFVVAEVFVYTFHQ